MTQTMKKKELEMLLEKVRPFAEPDPRLEQYPTPAVIAADITYSAYAAGDIEGMKVLDLGCGESEGGEDEVEQLDDADHHVAGSSAGEFPIELADSGKHRFERLARGEAQDGVGRAGDVCGFDVQGEEAAEEGYLSAVEDGERELGGVVHEIDQSQGLAVLVAVSEAGIDEQHVAGLDGGALSVEDMHAGAGGDHRHFDGVVLVEIRDALIARRDFPDGYRQVLRRVALRIVLQGI